MSPVFKGIPADAFDFFEELAADNNKAWWTENKARYESNVRGPVEALLTDVEKEFGPAKIFRPYRDTRFSKDKTPYKTNLVLRAPAASLYLLLWNRDVDGGSVDATGDRALLDEWRTSVTITWS